MEKLELLLAPRAGISRLTAAVHLLDFLFASSRKCSKAFRILIEDTSASSARGARIEKARPEV